ncbi:MAG: TonB-dependent receptor [Bacteroidales bacterium]
MMRLLLILLFVLPGIAISAQEVELSGRVLLPDSSAAADAVVYLENSTAGSVADKIGTFRIGKIKAGYHLVRVSLIGYETIEKEVTLVPGENQLDFILVASQINLNEVVVTGTRTEKTLKTVPVITQTISARKMLDLGIHNVTEALQEVVPGFSISRLGTKTSVTMQGMDAKYVLFLIDGERIAGEVNGDIDYSMLNLEQVERIEVIKGASSSLYGSNAIGGVINIITKKINRPFEGRFFSKYARNNELNTGSSVAWKKKFMGGRTGFNYNRTDGYDLTPETPHDWTQNPYHSLSFSQRFEFTPGNSLTLAPYVNYYRFERKNVSVRPTHDMYQQYNIGLKGKYYMNNNNLEFSLYRDRYNTFNVLELLDNELEKEAYDIIHHARVQGSFKISEKHSFITGVEYSSETLYSVRNQGGVKDEGEAVVYAQDDLKIGEKWNIVAGIRGSHHSSYGFHAAPKVSAMFRHKSFNLRASAGTGFRSPSLKELYMYFDHFGEWYVIGNADLKPESSAYFTASVEYSKPWNNSSLTVYRNVLSDMITDRWLPDSAQPTRQYQNIASAHVSGMDLLTKQKLLPNLWLSLGYSYVYSHDNQSGEQLYGTTRHSGNASADYHYRKKNYSLIAQLHCRFSGEKFYEKNTEGLENDKPYANLKITITQGYKWIKVTTGVDNLLNTVLPDNLNFISPGRSYFIGLNITI